jgi:hypothetical protein
MGIPLVAALSALLIGLSPLYRLSERSRILPDASEEINDKARLMPSFKLDPDRLTSDVNPEKELFEAASSIFASVPNEIMPKSAFSGMPFLRILTVSAIELSIPRGIEKLLSATTITAPLPTGKFITGPASASTTVVINNMRSAKSLFDKGL